MLFHYGTHLTSIMNYLLNIKFGCVKFIIIVTEESDSTAMCTSFGIIPGY